MDLIDRALELSRSRRNLPAPDQRKAIREAASLSQADIAEALGVTRAAVARWEAGTRRPTGRKLVAYQGLLDRLSQEVGDHG
jgi:DNA-binding transcriptional regulator YiaG